MSKNRKHEEGKENSERWLLTYSDMITLLLALFIMLYCMSNVDTEKFKAVAEQLGIAFSSGKSVVVGAAQSSNSDINITIDPARPTAQPSEEPSPSASGGDIKQENIENMLSALISSYGLSPKVSVRTEERGVVVSLQDALLFDSGSATVHQSSVEILKKLTDIVNSVDNYIHIEGSTDNVPISNGQFSSNWELAAQRAINVGKVLIGNGVDPTRITATSLGEYHPVADNETEDQKQQNRRVDIVFVNEQYNINEPGHQN